MAVADMDPPLALPAAVPGGARGAAADGDRHGDGDGLLPAAVTALLDRSPGPDAAARARALDKSADDYGDQQRPANTARSYKADWRRWEDYTAWAGIPMLSGGRGALVGFVVWLEHGGPRPGSMGHWPRTRRPRSAAGSPAWCTS